LKVGLKKITQWATKNIDFTDILLIIGAAAIFYGAYLIYKPVAFLLLGAGLIYLAIRFEGQKTVKP
jgi:small-conductance mechanosensitive channel